MVSRALIIAIEEYPNVAEPGMDKKLDNTLKGALAFKAWLEAKWRQQNLPGEDTEMVFCSEPRQPFGFGATRSDLLTALNNLKISGRNMTDELYFYFSGHGFAFLKDDSRSDIIIASDYETALLSAHCCLNLDKIIFWLRSHLGIGKQFYFIDACRGPLDGTKIASPEQPLPFDPKSNGEPTTFILQSTITNAASIVGGAFQKTLLAGLQGNGSAKTWDDDTDEAMFVRYDSLRLYLTEKLKEEQPIYNRVEGTAGEKDGILYELRPVPLVDCTIRIKGGSAHEKGKILYRRGRARQDVEVPFDGLPAKLSLEPDVYKIAVHLENGSVSPADHVRIENYDDVTLTFDKEIEAPVGEDVLGGLLGGVVLPDRAANGLEAADFGLERRGGGGRRRAATRRKPRKRKRQAPRFATLEVTLPPDTRVDLRHKASGRIVEVTGTGGAELRTGRYQAMLYGADGAMIEQRDVQISASSRALQFADWQASPPRGSIATYFPEHEGSLQFSEALMHEPTEADLDMWLAIIGAGRILSQDAHTYYKIGQLPLRDFWHETPGGSSIYVLAGFEEPGTGLQVSISPDSGSNWRQASRPGDLALWEAYAALNPGQYFVSFRIGEGIPHTIASHALANRSTLITLTTNPGGQPQIVQYMLPVGNLVDRLPDLVRTFLSRRNQLDDVRKITRLHRAFRARRDVFEVVPDVQLEELLYCKWGNPVGSTLAAYELMRRGKLEMMAEVAHNMRIFFPDLPDTAAIVNLAANDAKAPRNGVPMFLDGLRAFPDSGTWLPFSSSHLDYTSPWTAWRAVVSA